MCDDTLYGYVQASVRLPILFPDSGLMPATSSSAGEGHGDEGGKDKGGEKDRQRGGERDSFNDFGKGIAFDSLGKVSNLVHGVNLETDSSDSILQI